MQKFLCCDAANPKTHDDGKVRLTFAHGCRIDRPWQPIARPTPANNAVNLWIWRDNSYRLTKWRIRRANPCRGRVSWIKCAKKLGILEFSYARIACVSPIGSEYKFIITRVEIAPASGPATGQPAAVRGISSGQAACGSDHVRRCLVCRVLAFACRAGEGPARWLALLSSALKRKRA